MHMGVCMYEFLPDADGSWINEWLNAYIYTYICINMYIVTSYACSLINSSNLKTDFLFTGQNRKYLLVRIGSTYWSKKQ
jgi:hypothetical protein